jgi:hypothetical protein
MNIPNQAFPRTIRVAAGLHLFCPKAVIKLVLATALLFMAPVLISKAANVTLKSNDALGTLSVTGSTNWSNVAVPSAGNTYFTTNASSVGLLMRRPKTIVCGITESARYFRKFSPS